MPYVNEPYSVQRKSQSPDEKRVVEFRKGIVAKNMSTYLDLQIPLDNDEVLTIALCTSGGGYRALISTLGFLAGLQEIGMLDLVTYMSSLSGSAWALGAWISSQEKLNAFAVRMRENISKNSLIAPNKALPQPITNADAIHSVTTQFVTKFIFDQPLTATDLWGALIVNNILAHHPDAQTWRLSDQSAILSSGRYPFPLYTAVSPLTDSYPTFYGWYEFSPVHIANLTTQTYITPWAFGRTYAFGDSYPEKIDLHRSIFPPEWPLSSFLGIFGSAFTVNLSDIVNKMERNADGITFIQKKVLEAVLEQDQRYLQVGTRRVLPGKAHNPLWKINAPIGMQKYITLVDAGIDFNLPVPPLLVPQRNIDFIIMFDASSDYASQAPALQAAAQYAYDHNLPFPPLDLRGIALKEVSVFQAPRTPTVVYMPFINTCLDLFCGTFNFAYTKEQFDYVYGKAKQLVINNKAILKKAMLDAQLAKIS